MNKQITINQVVNKAYYNLTSLVELNATLCGGYFDMIIPEGEFNNLANYIDEIINNLFDKFCEEISKKITDNEMKSIEYKTYCHNIPNENFIKDCFEFVNNQIQNKKSSKPTTTLINSLTSLRQMYSKKEFEKSLNTIFDILLNYNSITKK